MSTSFSSATRHHLPRQTTLRLHGPMCVRTTAGTLWLTLDGDPADHVLEPGESLLLAGRLPAVLTALGGDVTVELSRPAPASAGTAWWRRMARTAAGSA